MSDKIHYVNSCKWARILHVVERRGEKIVSYGVAEDEGRGASRQAGGRDEDSVTVSTHPEHNDLSAQAELLQIKQALARHRCPVCTEPVTVLIMNATKAEWICQRCGHCAYTPHRDPLRDQEVEGWVLREANDQGL